jgi:hypothetical protein
MSTFTVKEWVVPRVPDEGGVIVIVRALTGNGDENQSKAPTTITRRNGMATLLRTVYFVSFFTLASLKFL